MKEGRKLPASVNLIRECFESRKMLYNLAKNDFKTKYAEKGEDIQAVLDYSALEAQADLVKSKLKELKLTEVSSDEIEAFYGKIEELKEIISK